MKQRLVALLLLVGVVGAVAFGRARPHFVDARASISAPAHALELPPAVVASTIFVAPREATLPIISPAPLVSASRTAPLYLHHRSLLL